MIEYLKEILKEDGVKYVEENYPTLKMFLNATERELQQIPGVGKTKAKEFYILLNLPKSQQDYKGSIISSPRDVFDMLKHMQHFENEHFYTLYLNTKNIVIHCEIISIGTLGSTLVHPREVFAPAVRLKAASIIAVHNHPSGDTKPSKEDKEITTRIKESGKIIGINILDHIIIGDNKYQSFKELGLI